ncbi:uncharacterized protein LOC112905858 [Agrilus planipennis]|uniref:Uncharacterized protein LOC112905858 n=1 Tax=Agrilus planipennis TaxID=224129 RepID=A0A7F5RG01_AGRPL|nr:uncharacterized protein LOC112905858 [Agrilus planipennis]
MHLVWNIGLVSVTAAFITAFDIDMSVLPMQETLTVKLSSLFVKAKRFLEESDPIIKNDVHFSSLGFPVTIESVNISGFSTLKTEFEVNEATGKLNGSIFFGSIDLNLKNMSTKEHGTVVNYLNFKYEGLTLEIKGRFNEKCEKFVNLRVIIHSGNILANSELYIKDQRLVMRGDWANEMKNTNLFLKKHISRISKLAAIFINAIFCSLSHLSV